MFPNKPNTKCQITEKNTGIPKILFIINFHTGHANEHLNRVIDNIYEMRANNIFKFDVSLITNRDEPLEKILTHRLQMQIIHRARKPVGILLNEAIKQAIKNNYDIMIKQDADDRSVPNRIDLQVNFIKQNPDFIFYGGAIQTSESSTNSCSMRVYPRQPRLIDFLLNKSIAHCAVAFNLKNYKSHNISYPIKHFLEDKILLSSPENLSKVINQKQIIVIHQLNKGARSGLVIAIKSMVADLKMIFRKKKYAYIHLALLIFVVRCAVPVDQLRNLRDRFYR